MMNRRLWLLLLLSAWLVTAVALFAQSEPALQLSLRRDFGLGMGANIQGTFSLRATGPADLERVIFFIDDQPLAEVAAPPFQVQFHTDTFAEGPHTLAATGYTTSGVELRANTLTRNFLPAGAGTNFAIWLGVAVVVLGLGGSWLTSKIAGRGRANAQNGDVAISGLFGGTICPKCARPFARHWWGLNLVVGKYDRCPHCGKWSLVQAVHPDVLAASQEAMRQADAQETAAAAPDAAASARRRLDDSRFES